jgi:hypothetical protein
MQRAEGSKGRKSKSRIKSRKRITSQSKRKSRKAGLLS